MGLRADNLRTHTMIAAWEWPSYMDPEARDRGIKVRSADIFALMSWQEMLYRAAPRLLPIVGCLVLPLVLEVARG